MFVQRFHSFKYKILDVLGIHACNARFHGYFFYTFFTLQKFQIFYSPKLNFFNPINYGNVTRKIILKFSWCNFMSPNLLTPVNINSTRSVGGGAVIMSTVNTLDANWVTRQWLHCPVSTQSDPVIRRQLLHV